MLGGCIHGHAPDRYNRITKQCRECCRLAKRKSPSQWGLIPYGVTRRSWMARVAAMTKREKNGGAQTSGDEFGRRQRLARLNAKRRTGTRKALCVRGHAMTKDNTYWYRVKRGRQAGMLRRMCRACVLVRTGRRPPFVEMDGVKVSVRAHDRWFLRERKKLLKVVVDAHPDKGGTSRKFIAARKALDAFVAEEQRWYARLGLSVPDKRNISTEDESDEAPTTLVA